ncbi:hypothetical protein [Pseudomonas fluorescens]|nr:hypothetical protein [Pseudomonas fluorescens]VVQ04236.1 hypothetical protein PS906_05306 [Pseudomonas fluorescens]
MQTAIEIAQADHQLIVRIIQAWTKCATVCSPDRGQAEEVSDPARPDDP